ncbi:hypothetical protein KHA79_18730 [Xanthomonas translucens pv. cerealis]|nr:hypothetical protein KHA79_18730 [Xanthomonas translucens pv. cerealis]
MLSASGQERTFVSVWQIRENLLTRWKRDAQSEGQMAFGGTETPRDGELARLKLQLGQVKNERDLLREAATFFANGLS